MAIRASRTSSNLNGLIIAITIFMGPIELCVNLGDVADQASWLCLVWTTSMPSANLTPATIFGN